MSTELNESKKKYEKELRQIREKAGNDLLNAVAKTREEDESRFSGSMTEIKNEVNQTKNALIELDKKYQELADENKKLKLKLDVKQELQQLSQGEKVDENAREILQGDD